MNDEEVRTFPLDLEETATDITVNLIWAQRQTNGAVICRIHVRSPRHSAGELLLTDTDLIALDADERPLRTQVRRYWGYNALADVTPAAMQIARFDVGFRVDLAATRGQCALSIALIRAFRPSEGPRAYGGPWVFQFRVAEDAEIESLLRAEAARQEAQRQEAARQEAARQEAARVEAERREALRQERLRAEAARQERFLAQQAAREAERFTPPVSPQAEPQRESRGESRPAETRPLQMAGGNAQFEPSAPATPRSPEGAPIADRAESVSVPAEEPARSTPAPRTRRTTRFVKPAPVAGTAAVPSSANEENAEPVNPSSVLPSAPADAAPAQEQWEAGSPATRPAAETAPARPARGRAANRRSPRTPAPEGPVGIEGPPGPSPTTATENQD